ncbi:hypothetical protein [Winogradskyella bathintestinalis]|uniref:Lipoprotein n=1 Tax=Winogradskyella bathintestinalis TaxID=3035208 RepID=A0ABT7ZZ44_9FLAO|nr:hypothetical protein [Winogradskyella bathintestinalis]MDN3494278.1 hypothetical protein [Winogradskyella bathintestinalis]
MNYLKFTIALILTLTIFSCTNNEIVENEESTHIYKSEKVNFTQIINNRMGNKSKSTKDSDDYIHSEFETTMNIPENLSDNELDDFIMENQNSIDGTLRYLINDNDYITIEIVNGIQSSAKTNKNNFLRQDYPCTYDGIQDCVQHAVYEEWSTYTALKCAFTGGTACIIDEAISCAEENCL